MSNYPNKPSSAPAIVFGSVGKSKVVNDIISAIGVEKLLALKTDGTYDDNFSIGNNSLNSLVNEINIREGSTIKEYDATGTSLLRTMTLGSSTTTVQGFRYLDFPIKISNNATNPLTTIDVSAGAMTFDDGSGQALLPTGLSRSTANDFQNGGLLPNGATLQTSTFYYVFAIYSTASNQVSFYADTNFSNPTLPVAPLVYDKKEYRGSFLTDNSGNIRKFILNDRYYFFDQNITDISSQSIGTSKTSIPCSTPNQLEVLLFGTSWAHHQYNTVISVEFYRTGASSYMSRFTGGNAAAPVGSRGTDIKVNAINGSFDIRCSAIQNINFITFGFYDYNIRL